MRAIVWYGKTSKKSSLSQLVIYERTLTKMQIDPYPITIEKMKGFLVLKMKSNRKYSTLVNYIAAFSYYFRQNALDILTNSLEFKTFKAGLRRLMHGDTFSNAKLPFNHIWFLGNLEKFSLNNLDDLKLMFLMMPFYQTLTIPLFHKYEYNSTYKVKKENSDRSFDELYPKICSDNWRLYSFNADQIRGMLYHQITTNILHTIGVTNTC